MVSQMSSTSRHMLIASSVVLFHMVAIWVIQTGLVRQALEAVVPVNLLSEFLEPPRPKLEPPPKPLAQPVQHKAAPPPPPTTTAMPTFRPGGRCRIGHFGAAAIRMSRGEWCCNARVSFPFAIWLCMPSVPNARGRATGMQKADR